MRGGARLDILDLLVPKMMLYPELDIVDRTVLQKGMIVRMNESENRAERMLCCRSHVSRRRKGGGA